MTSKYDFKGVVDAMDAFDLGCFTRHEIQTIRAALSILARVQSGELAVVPVVPTSPMIASMVLGMYDEKFKAWENYHDMLKTAPSIEELLGVMND